MKSLENIYKDIKKDSMIVLCKNILVRSDGKVVETYHDKKNMCYIDVVFESGKVFSIGKRTNIRLYVSDLIKNCQSQMEQIVGEDDGLTIEEKDNIIDRLNMVINGHANLQE
jgi:hypothetical protein